MKLSIFVNSEVATADKEVYSLRWSRLDAVACILHDIAVVAVGVAVVDFGRRLHALYPHFDIGLHAE